MSQASNLCCVTGLVSRLGVKVYSLVFAPTTRTAKVATLPLLLFKAVMSA